MRGLEHVKRMSKKVDADRAWLDYYSGRSTKKRRAGGRPFRSVIRVGGRSYHYTKGWRVA